MTHATPAVRAEPAPTRILAGHFPLALVTVLFGLGLSACGDASSSRSAVQDSAGVTIATSGAPAWGEDSRWTVDPEPSVAIGTAEGRAATTLDGAYSALRLRNGHVVVADGGTQELRWFDSAGRHVRSVGREGQGPREFGAISGLVFLRDTILVWDSRNTRLARVTAGGEFIGTTPFEHPEGESISRYRPVGAWSDSALLMARSRFAIPAPGDAGPVWDAAPNRVYGLDGHPRDSVGRSGQQQYRSPGRDMRNSFFTLRTSNAIRDGRLYTGTGEAWEIEVLGAGGRHERLIRLDRDREPLTEADHGAIVDRIMSMLPADVPPEAAAEGRRQLEEAWIPASKPAYGALVVDSEGYLWASEFRHLREYGLPGARRWTVIDPNGRWLGDLTLPDMEVFEIGRDWILGWRRDELGVERVVIHGLDRGDDAGSDG